MMVSSSINTFTTNYCSCKPIPTSPIRRIHVRPSLDNAIEVSNGISYCSSPIQKKRSLIDHHSLSFTKHHFQILKSLSPGQYGKTYVVRSKLNQQIYCMKIQSKRLLKMHSDRVSFDVEQAILSLQHPCLPRLYCSFEDDTDHYLVMDYFSGGDLFSLLDRQPTLCLTEKQAQFYMAEMILACQALHQLGYLHRDIKPQNILLDHLGHVKLVDFGSSILISQATKNKQSTPVGTCDYVSPEILDSFQGDATYGTEVDCWSLGICLYEMLQELPPFYSDVSENDTYRKILFHQGQVSFNDMLPISDQAKDLINNLLTKRENRLTLDQIKMHSFFDGIDWDTIYQSKPPFRPRLHSDDDTSNFFIPQDILQEAKQDDNPDDDDDDYISLSQPITPPLSPLLKHTCYIPSSLEQ
ncbi:kinase-like domain-containing protein [Halteromyces radiatus]|uniref:kinase-like domain-containing protein n=1 Tax=Halteromyces radiatus TaxID=101107 RepID=UPI00221EFCAA|nr:kinase-like domain-containing protein [Halteromyces radiatus]KAI8097251.1 kinase-like domain-containing protein [Halteromyces radiatus]